MKIEQRILALYDFHSDPTYVPLIRRFIWHFHPTVIVWGGDIGNWDIVSMYHKAGKEKARLCGETVEWEENHIREHIVEPIVGESHMGTRHVFLKGNHEARLDQFADIEAIYGSYYSSDSVIRRLFPYEHTPVIFEHNEPYWPTKNLGYFHGLFTTQYHTTKTVNSIHKTCIYGHTHDVQQVIAVSPLDSSEYMYAKSVGCLCRRNPEYLRNRPNRWVNAFSVAYITDTGVFNEYTIFIIKGSFIWNGRVFSL